MLSGDPSTVAGPVGDTDSLSKQEQDVTDQNTQSNETTPTEYNKLSAMETSVLLYKDTEFPDMDGHYRNLMEPGTYICKRCNAPLYRSEDKFIAHCGWPAFDNEIKGAVHREVDADGRRVEIVCNNCGGHLGHVFEGEGYTETNTRHCVSAISMKFIPNGLKLPLVIRPGARQNGTAELPELPDQDNLLNFGFGK
ncbi:MAG: methionine-R-sulfoxide reductase [Planctomycetaceae bacterium]|nr:methionine-R-sulfoxide reductase [Planctomycetaceae bacterium]